MPWRDRYSGSCRLYVCRPAPKRKTPSTSEWLPGRVPLDEVESEALALLEDPRDTIDSIDVWSLSEEKFVMTYRKEKAA